MNDLKWRLKEAPTAEGVAALVQQGVLKPDEAREIVLSTKEVADVEKKQLEEKVEFLQGLVDTLSRNQPTTVYYPRWVEARPWFNTWYTMTTGGNTVMTLKANSTNAFSSVASGGLNGATILGSTATKAIN